MQSSETAIFGYIIPDADDMALIIYPCFVKSIDAWKTQVLSIARAVDDYIGQDDTNIRCSGVTMVFSVLIGS